MKIKPYLNFNGRCDDAIEFYKSSLGAKVGTRMRFKDAPPDCQLDLKLSNKVMHASLQVGDSALLCTDGRCNESTKFEGITLSLWLETLENAQQKFDQLADGGSITMPMTKTFFASKFGMVTDRFGVGWMVLAGN